MSGSARVLVALVLSMTAAIFMQGRPARAAADENSGSQNGTLVFCYDRAREIVQQKLSHNCSGEIISRDKAAAIERRARTDRLERLRKIVEEPQPPADQRIGTGFFVSHVGHVLTARHVVEGCGRILIERSAGARQPATLVAVADRDADIALLRVRTEKTNRATLASSSPERFDAPVVAFGFPALGRAAIRPIRTEGQLIGLRTLGNSQRPLLLFRAEIHRGNSGGPLFDAHGRVVGLVVALINTSEVYARTQELIRHVAFAEPVETLDAFLRRQGVPFTSSDAPPPNSEGTAALTRVLCDPPI